MQIMVTLAKCKPLLAGWLRRLLDAHRRRIKREQDFYRNLATYCRDNGLSPICEDDWKTAAYTRNGDDPSTISSKGDVLWRKANLPR
jgi:hypothetical protein